METKATCPKCGKTLAANVPLGLCPECLIRAGFPTDTEPGTATHPRFTPPSVEEIRTRFPQFEIVSLIGQGGMGAVYKARQPSLDRFIALKILPPVGTADAGYTERFTREARALARLNHPNIVAVYGFGETAGQPFLVMEFVDGLNLREVQAAGRLAPEKALQIIPQICDALEFAHGEGIVHRDIKPENILVDKKGRVKITDFGIAKILGPSEDKISLTGAKDIVGTPHYMAPEQIEHPRFVDHRADIYSLGVVFYELLTGELPLGKFQPPSRKVQVDVRLDDVVLHALEKEPERRYQRAEQVKTDVQSIAAGDAPSAIAANAFRDREQWLERRRKYLLWYGVIASACGLPISLLLRLPVVAALSVAGLVVGFYKLGWFRKAHEPQAQGSQPQPEPASAESSLTSATWPPAGALSAVAYFGLLPLVLTSSHRPQIAIGLITVLTLILPFLFLGARQLVSRWTIRRRESDAPEGAAFLKAALWTGVLLTALYGGFGIFFIIALMSENGGWHPARLEALVVPLSWVGAILLPVASWVLFGSSRKRAPTTAPLNRVARWALICLLVLLAAASAMYAGRNAQTTSITITGTVMDSTTGKPIPSARVDDNTYDAGPRKAPRQTWTDAQGAFKLLTVGEEHTISISAPGYETKLHTVQTDSRGRYIDRPLNIQLQKQL